METNQVGRRAYFELCKRQHAQVGKRVENVKTRPRGVRTDRQRRKWDRIRVSWGWDERPVYEYLEMVVRCMQGRRLFQEEIILDILIPFYWGHHDDLAAKKGREGVRDSRWAGTESIHLFIMESSSAIIFWSERGDDLSKRFSGRLTEYCVEKDDNSFGLVTNQSYQRAEMAITHDKPHRTSHDVHQTKVGIEVWYSRRLSWGLFESAFPVIVVAFGKQVKVKTVQCNSKVEG